MKKLDCYYFSNFKNTNYFEYTQSIHLYILLYQVLVTRKKQKKFSILTTDNFRFRSISHNSWNTILIIHQKYIKIIFFRLCSRCDLKVDVTYVVHYFFQRGIQPFCACGLRPYEFKNGVAYELMQLDGRYIVQL